jgi:hypothetical protein
MPSGGASDWRRLLALPDTQGRWEKSAMELAVSWDLAQ